MDKRVEGKIKYYTLCDFAALRQEDNSNENQTIR